jgi:DNA-binding Lrp family transcriptional regulator
MGIMIQILSFIKLELGKTNDVINALKAMAVVKEIYYISGEFDLAVLMEGDTEEELNDAYLEGIDTIKGIALSNSHLIIKHWNVQADKEQ